MPFVHESEGRWRTGSTIDLRQLPQRGRMTVRFELLDELGYTTRPPDGGDGSGPSWSRSAVEHVVPVGFVTDLTSVPELLWGVIASYGRQTLPAALHDHLYAAAAPAGSLPRARRLRREADVLFRATLRESGAGPVRQWLMRAAVRTFGSPLVVVPLVALAVVLLLVGVLAVAGLLTVPRIAWAAGLVAAAGVVAAVVVTAVEEDTGGGVGLRPTALLSQLGACCGCAGGHTARRRGHARDRGGACGGGARGAARPGPRRRAARPGRVRNGADHVVAATRTAAAGRGCTAGGLTGRPVTQGSPACLQPRRAPWSLTAPEPPADDLTEREVRCDLGASARSGDDRGGRRRQLQLLGSRSGGGHGEPDDSESSSGGANQGALHR